jgi:hypothetical protein
MTLPDPEGRPVWEPVVIALFLALVIAWDGQDMLALIRGHMPATAQARAALELGVAAMLLWGLGRSLLNAAAWTPGTDDAA